VSETSDRQAVRLQIGQYANIETADSLRAYIEKFTPVYEVKMVRANKAKGLAKCALMSCRDGDGMRSILDATRKHTLNGASLSISLCADAPIAKGEDEQGKDEKLLEEVSATCQENDDKDKLGVMPPSKKRRTE